MKLLELFEALSDSQWEKLQKQFTIELDRNKYKELFSKFPHNETMDRIYIPANGVSFDAVLTDNPIETEVKQVLSANDFNVVDYAGNKAEDSKKQPRKIGKILRQVDPALYDKYVKDNDNKAMGSKKNVPLLICISRNPRDIGAMSTGQNWTSCMNMDDGEMNKYVHAEIQNGTIIAYLIREDDKELIQPIARCLILPFVNKKKITDFMLGVTNIVYPRDSRIAESGFLEAVGDWADSVNDSNVLDGTVYELMDGHYGEASHEIMANVKNMSYEEVLQMVAEDGMLYLHLPQKYKNDREMLLTAVDSDGAIYEFLPAKHKNDVEIAKLAVNSKGIIFKHLPDQMKQSKELAKIAMRQNVWCYRDLPENLRGDKELAKMALRSSANKQYVPKNLLDDPHFKAAFNMR